MDGSVFSRMVSGAITRFCLIGCELPAHGVLAGPQKLDYLPRWTDAPELWMGEDNRHFPLNDAVLMREGISGLMASARAGRENASSVEQKMRLTAILTFLQAYQSFILAHAVKADVHAQVLPDQAVRYRRIAANCRAIAQRAPSSFEEGIQLFYFTWRVRSVNYTSCIGRFDVQLGPLYERSIKDGMTRDTAHGLVCELIRKLNAMGNGDTLMNMMLGGVDEEGKDVSGELAVLMMECSAELGLSEPHINVRIHRDMPDFFGQAVSRLIAKGQGQGTLYVDEEIIPRLVENGIPLPIAREYANDGCTEITLEGHAAIEFWQMESMKSLELALFNGEENPTAPYTPVAKWNRHEPASRFHSRLKFGVRSGHMRECCSFEEVMVCFYRQWDAQLAYFCGQIARKIEEDGHTDRHQSSLLVQSLLPRVLDTGNEAFRGGYECYNYQLLSGSIPTVVDSLYAMKVAVFERKLCTMEALLDALCHDFEGHDILREQLLRIDKFGNDVDAVDLLAAQLVTHLCDYVQGYSFPDDVKVLTGIYNIDFLLFATSLGATPDGRKAGDAICCHYSPTPGCAHKGVTAALLSASKADLSRGVAASPVYLTLPRLLDTDYAAVFASLIQGAVALHLPIINFSIVDVEELRDAQKHPEKHRDLVVRVWGYNAYFIDLEDGLQQHIIDRTLQQ